MKEKIIYLDEQLPPVNQEVPLVIVEVPHGESTESKLEIHYDEGGRNKDGTWWTDNDCDEGQSFAVVGWLQLQSEEEIRKHKINWHNVSDSMDNMLGREKRTKINWVSDWTEDQKLEHLKKTRI